ncbi:MAG TPA: hypothetical protein VGQ26_01245 [Streptosporangiaceae bacterium]|nr:hypothetical protein [Streptosporangiaceae bacterium]
MANVVGVVQYTAQAAVLGIAIAAVGAASHSRRGFHGGKLAGVGVPGLRGISEMLSAAYAVARWVEYVSGALALVALATITWRLLRRPHKRILGAVSTLVVAGAMCAATFAFLGTRVEQVRLDSIKQLGLEARHSGLRTNALVYDLQESVPVTLRPLPPGVPLSKVINNASAYLVHQTTTVHPKAAVYGLIDFAAVKSEYATVDRQARTIVLSLPKSHHQPGHHLSCLSQWGSGARRPAQRGRPEPNWAAQLAHQPAGDVL